ncbi:MAG: flagellin, partial [Oscillospiraceae bacterium]|nr:flagellin [Oscillospiraceae bacterium]
MVVQHNISAMNANRYFGINNSGLAKSLEKLSSGYAINRAGDNAAGLAVSEKMRAQISGLTQASKNAEDGISMVQTFEGALQESDSILQRMRTLAVQSANGTYQNDVDREAIQLEFDQLNDELNQIADTDFNGVIVLNGGEMADGTKADAAGNINYATATRQAQQVGTAGGFVKGIGTANYAGTNTETVTFTATKNSDGTVSWEKSDGALGTLSNNTDKTGGFTYDGATVVVDTDKIVSGDTITISFDKKVAAVGQTNDTIGVTEDLGKTGGTTTTKAGLQITATDATVTSQELADALNSLNGLTMEETYAKDATAPTAASTKINGVSVNGATDATPIEIGKVGDGSLVAKANGVIAYKSKDGTVTDIAKYTASEMTGKAVNAGTVTTKFYVGEASFTPASDKAVQLVEPDGKVSQANSNDASTATLTYTDNITLQTGARTKDSVNFTFAYESKGLGELKADLDCSARGLGTDKLSLATQEGANAAIDKIDNAINKVSMVRASFGAMQNRLEHKIANLNTNNENLTAAESRIRDTDMAKEMTNFTKNQILSQASQAMLAQANQLP